MPVETKTLRFSVEGEFITRAAREALYYDHDIERAVKLLMASLVNDTWTEEQRFIHCLKVLNGDAQIEGNTGDGSYCLNVFDDDEPRNFDKRIIDAIREMKQETADLKEQIKDYEKKLCAVGDILGQEREYLLPMINRRYHVEYDGRGELFEAYKQDESPLLSFMSGQVEEYLDHKKKERDDDYGWLEPNGTFHVVEWANHNAWAERYVLEHSDMSESDLREKYKLCFADYLYDHGWVLLHSPSGSTARPTQSDVIPLTPAQKNFLFAYYTDRGRHDLASECMAQDD